MIQQQEGSCPGRYCLWSMYMNFPDYHQLFQKNINQPTTTMVVHSTDEQENDKSGGGQEHGAKW